MKKFAYFFVALLFAGATVSFAGENGTCTAGSKTCTKGASMSSASCHSKGTSATASSSCDMSKTTASADYGKCPVSGHNAVKKVTYKYKGTTYHFCCKDCIKDFKANPAKYTVAEKTDNTKSAQ